MPSWPFRNEPDTSLSQWWLQVAEEQFVSRARDERKNVSREVDHEPAIGCVEMGPSNVPAWVRDTENDRRRR